MDFSRRGFLHLLGIGGLAAGAAGNLGLPLFGSDEVKGLIVPDQKMTAGHFAVYPKRLSERIPLEERAEITRAYGRGPTGTVACFLHPDLYVPVARLTRNREPQKPIVTRRGGFSVTPRLPDGTMVRDAHTAFYMASKDIHNRFAAFSRETLLEVPFVQRSMASIVTIIDSPIHARPTGLHQATTDEDRRNRWGMETDTEIAAQTIPWEGDNDGFDVVCSFRQFAVLGMQRREIDTFEIYSEQGEYPLQVPSDVEMGMLLRMDREVIKLAPSDPKALASILTNLSGWRT
jgi:hypothetical protein